jgi:Ca2+-binding EF-hand superfamily protein
MSPSNAPKPDGIPEYNELELKAIQYMFQSFSPDAAGEISALQLRAALHATYLQPHQRLSKQELDDVLFTFTKSKPLAVNFQAFLEGRQQQRGTNGS